MQAGRPHVLSSRPSLMETSRGRPHRGHGAGTGRDPVPVAVFFMRPYAATMWIASGCRMANAAGPSSLNLVSFEENPSNGLLSSETAPR